MSDALKQGFGVVLLAGGVATHIYLKGAGELPTLALIVIGGLLVDPAAIVSAIKARFNRGD